jgi:hypothetical protein
VLLLLVGLAAGCGYRQDVPVLLGGGQRLAIGPIRNLSYAGELDTRLRAQLQARLLRHAGLRLVPPAQSDLLLTIEITDLRIDRGLDGSAPGRRSLVFVVSGRLTAEDQHNGRKLIAGEALSASSQVLFDPPLLETIALRDEGINGAVDAFAAQVEQRLFFTF